MIEKKKLLKPERYLERNLSMFTLRSLMPGDGEIWEDCLLLLIERQEGLTGQRQDLKLGLGMEAW